MNYLRPLILLIMLFLVTASPASADWRWAKPQLKKQTVTYSCASMKCIRQTYLKEKRRYHRRVERYDKRRQHEWSYWTHLFIPTCTWYGESGYGPEYARVRYTMPNATGSGAYGKFQFMPGTYHNRAKYHDWSPLDQEIAARREYWANGTSPWTNCH
jgi:hypothetical protein